jgi:hypothetical protein
MKDVSVDESASGRPRSHRVGRIVVIVAALGVLATGLSACQVRSGYQYISHRSSDGVNMYFKAPVQWTIFDTKAVIEAENGPLGPTQQKQIAGGEWVETLSAQPNVSVKDTLGIGKRYPSAIVVARPLGATERDNLSFMEMRTQLLQTDPLTATSGYDVISYNEFTGPNGVRGVRMVVDITSGSPVRTFGQITAVDADTNWIFSMGIGCEASCWGLNASSITSVLNSWTIKEQQR